MADTTFVDGSTKILAAWLNDVNDSVYSAIGAAGAAPTTPAQVLANIAAQAANAKLTAFSGLTGAANKVAYFTGASAMAVTDLTAFGRTVIGAADAAAGRAAMAIQAIQGSQQLIGGNNSGSPNNIVDFSAPLVIYRDNATGTLHSGADFTASVNINTAGPVANGRDQAGAFANSSWIQFYAIRKPDGTQAGLASLTRTTNGPGTLPSGYTQWAFLGAVYKDSGGNLLKVRQFGSKTFYETAVNVLSAGGATTETAISIAAAVPSGANYNISGVLIGTNDGSGNVHIESAVRLISGSNFDVNFAYMRITGQTAASTTQSVARTLTLPNISNQFFYLNTVSIGTTPQLSIWVNSYDVSNANLS